MLLSTSLFLIYYPSAFILHTCSMLFLLQLYRDLPLLLICSLHLLFFISPFLESADSLSHNNSLKHFFGFTHPQYSTYRGGHLYPLRFIKFSIGSVKTNIDSKQNLLFSVGAVSCHLVGKYS